MQVVGNKLLRALLQLARQVASGRRCRLRPHAAGQHLRRRGGGVGWSVVFCLPACVDARRSVGEPGCPLACPEGRRIGLILQLQIRPNTYNCLSLLTCTLMSTSSRLPCRSRCALKSAIFSLQMAKQTQREACLRLSKFALRRVALQQLPPMPLRNSTQSLHFPYIHPKTHRDSLMSPNMVSSLEVNW